MNGERTQRWWFARFIIGVSLAVGTIFTRPGPILIGIVGLGFLASAHLTSPSKPALEISRELSSQEPDPGDDVDVTLTIQNSGKSVLTDVRVVDGVPGEIEVVDGSPRMGTVLLPEGQVTLSYSIRAERGQHGFDPVTVVIRNLGGAFEQTYTFDVETVFTSKPSVYSVPLRSQTSQLAGDLKTDDPGSGLEFHSVRQYRSGDSLSRVDWRQYAKMGELTTIQYREERAAAVMLLVDARASAYWMGDGQHHHAVEHAVAAAGRIFGTLLAGGDRVGLTAFSDTDLWIPPGAGNEHAGRVRHILATHSAFDYTPPDDIPELAIYPDHYPVNTKPLLRRLRADNQLIITSPLTDDAIMEAISELAAHGHLVTVISPDPTGDHTRGQQMAGIQRRNRIHQLQKRNVRVIDWDVARPLSDALLSTGEST